MTLGFCDRCRVRTRVTIMSMFNQDNLCPECKEKEKKHPDYQKACKAEIDAVRSGNYNFKGIGKPDDL